MTQDAGCYEHFPHDADVGVRGFGPTLEAAFGQAALAMTAVITDPSKIADRERMDLECTAPDYDLLLNDWLNALIYAMADRHMLFGRFEVHIEDGRLRASAWGEPADRRRHEPAVEVKGATLTGLEVSRDANGLWRAQCVLDV
jgi:tRNA nucleotidyltransferase (CCA-adding enzyme)